MKSELATATLAAAALLGGAFASSASVGVDAADSSARETVKDLDAHRELTATPQPQDWDYEDGVSRSWGANRYATAAAIAENYGWTFENTGSVYIATGDDYADALALGPSTFGDGPLLLVKKGSIPNDTRRILEALQPCYINVVGGEGVISDTVFDGLKDHAFPELCEGE